MIFTLILIILILILLYFYYAEFYFTRAPKRNIPKGNVIVSPANGKVIAITRLKNIDDLNIEKGLLGLIRTYSGFINDGYMVSIMMKVNDVHVQRSPVAGRVTLIRHNKGTFLNAIREPEKMRWLRNENIETMIDSKEFGKVKVIQIAGVLARRCVSFLKVNQKVKKGEKIGLIKIGSQVSLIIPKIRLDVKLGDKVVEGETIIGIKDEDKTRDK